MDEIALRPVIGRPCQGYPPGDARYSAEEDPHRADGLRGEMSIAELCRREGIAEGLYYSWSRSS
jgi:hypothetical protein